MLHKARLHRAMEDERYEGALSNIISVTRGWVSVKFPEKSGPNTGKRQLEPGRVIPPDDFH